MEQISLQYKICVVLYCICGRKEGEHQNWVFSNFVK